MRIFDVFSRLPLLFVIVGILLSLMILGALITATIALRRRQQNKMRAREEFERNAVGPGAVNGVRSAGASTSEEIMLPAVAASSGASEEGEDRTETVAPLLSGGSLGRERKVSFRDSAERSTCPQCRHHYANTNGGLPNGAGEHRNGGGGVGLPVERAIVRTFSIDKLRPICPVCNPVGETPYPSDQQALDELHETAMKMLMNATK